MTVGNLQATADAIAESQNEISGFYQTRVTTTIVEGQSIWPVESVLDWPASGQVIARGVLYSYTGRSDTSLEGITYTDGEDVFTGAADTIVQESVITDFSRNRTAMDLLRRAHFTDTAEGSDLDTQGRNLGVNRLPTIPDDEIFRDIIQAVAYNPRGTIYGLELFLDAAVGPGNYEIIEDLIEDPNTVKVRFIGLAALDPTEFEGKAFLQGSENQVALTSTTLNISEAVVTNGTVHSVQFKDESHASVFAFPTAIIKPSAETIVEYIGDGGTQVWTFGGTTEGTEVITTPTTSPGPNIEIRDSNAAGVVYYAHRSQVQPESYAMISVVERIETVGSLSTTEFKQWCAYISDSSFIVSWGVEAIGSTEFRIGLADFSTDVFLGKTIILTRGVYYHFELQKHGTDSVRFYVDGKLLDEISYSLFTTADTTNELGFGSRSSPATGHESRYKEARYEVRTPTEYWGVPSSGGSVATAEPVEFISTAVTPFIGGGTDDNDLKELVIRNATALNAEGGTNNGRYVIELGGVGANDTVELSGKLQTEGIVQTADPVEFRAQDRVFQYPDDLGKTIRIFGATNPINNGSFTITELTDANDEATDLDSFATRTPEKTNIARVSGGSFITEPGLTWRLDPAFVDETSLDWEISDMGSVAGTVITLRTALPTLTNSIGSNQNRILNVTFSTVLSAQLLENILVNNVLVDAGPPRIYSHYPFYLADPFAFARFYVDLLTAAGVIPEFLGD